MSFSRANYRNRGTTLLLRAAAADRRQLRRRRIGLDQRPYLNIVGHAVAIPAAQMLLPPGMSRIDMT